MITTIIFDFAGVLTKETLLVGFVKKLQQKFDFDEDLFVKRFHDHEYDYMLALIGPKEFWERLCAGTGIPYDAFKDAFLNSYEFNPEMTEIIKKLKQKYRVFVLTDNYDIIAGKLKADSEFMGLFEKVFFSNEIKLVKTSPEAFQYLLDQIGEQPENCIFTDDKEKNLTPAASLGIKTIHFEEIASFTERLRSLGAQV